MPLRGANLSSAEFRCLRLPAKPYRPADAGTGARLRLKQPEELDQLLRSPLSSGAALCQLPSDLHPNPAPPYPKAIASPQRPNSPPKKQRKETQRDLPP